METGGIGICRQRKSDMFGANKIVSRLDEMLTDAINGRFTESNYDETELSRLESKFRQYLTGKETAAEKIKAERAAIKELVTDISHQTKTPIANISLYTQLLAEISPAELMPYVEQIRLQSEKLDFLIQSLTKMSRLERDMIKLHIVPQPVSLLIESAVREIKGQADEKRVSIHSEIQEDVLVSYDIRWTREALGNLLDNAVKYSPKGSTVTVCTYTLEMFLCISVEDEGAGIPEEERAQVFERFYRGKQAAQTDGNGVGLYLARAIVRKERGYMKVSDREGGGSCVRMYLPRVLQRY